MSVQPFEVRVSQTLDDLQAHGAYDEVPESRRQMTEAREGFRRQLVDVQRLIRAEVRQ